MERVAIAGWVVQIPARKYIYDEEKDRRSSADLEEVTPVSIRDDIFAGRRLGCRGRGRLASVEGCEEGCWNDKRQYSAASIVL